MRFVRDDYNPNLNLPPPPQGVEFPPVYTDTVSSFKVFNLDIIPSLNIECLYDFDFIDRFVKIAQIQMRATTHAEVTSITTSV